MALKPEGQLENIGMIACCYAQLHRGKYSKISIAMPSFNYWIRGSPVEV